MNNTKMGCVSLYCLLFFIVGAIFFSNALADEKKKPSITPGLINAHELAMRLYEKTQKFEEAAKLLENAKIGLILEDKPADLSQQQYVQILNDYAKILFQIPGRFLESEPLLSKVIKLQPDFMQTHLMLGDFYHRRNEMRPDKQFVKQYKLHYQYYIDQLKARKLRVLLPERIVQALYSTGNEDICQFVTAMSKNKLNYELDNFFNPETDIEILHRSAAGGFPNGENSFTFADFSAHAKDTIRKAVADIDNDGVAELRYSITEAASGCKRNLFFQQLTDKRVVLTHNLLDKYYQSGYLCGTDNLHVFAYRNRNYLLEKRSSSDGTMTVSIFDIAKKENFETVCSLSTTQESEYNIVSDCNLDVCRKLKSQFGYIIGADGQVGIEKLLSDNIGLVFSSQVMADPVLRKFTQSRHLYLADIDNDAEAELIARLWPMADSGQTAYEFRLFKKNGDQWLHYVLPAITGQSKSIPGSAWIFVMNYNHQNYLVSYDAYLSTIGTNTISHFELGIYHLGKEGFRLLGTLRAQPK